jgi:hypothetical protein
MEDYIAQMEEQNTQLLERVAHMELKVKELENQLKKKANDLIETPGICTVCDACSPPP